MSSSSRLIGYIGLGIMGQAMAGNLLKAGFPLMVYNRSADKAKALIEKGAKQAASPAEMARLQPQVIFINVTDTPDVEQVLFGPGGVSEGAQPGLIVVDNSTISPVATADFAQRLAQFGVTLLDAPVSGGDVGARNGTLSIMVGGEEAAFQTCLPMLQAMGKAITHLGPAGMGQTCKACNQIAVSINLLGVCEALALAKQCGLDLEKMIQVVNSGAGGSWQLANLGPKIAKGDYAPGFMIDLVLKDLAIVANTAREKKLPLTGAALAEGHFRAVAADENAGGPQNPGGKLGTQAMAKTLERLGQFKYRLGG